MRFRVFNEEVLYTDEPVTKVGPEDIVLLKKMAAGTPRRRVRLCTHPSVEHGLHEMLIVHERGCYVRPHRHPGKSESFHVIEGLVLVILFEEGGAIREVLRLGPPGEAPLFYHRIDTPVYHTVLPQSDWVVFHEVTGGPFIPGATEFAPWSPSPEDATGQTDFIKTLNQKVGALA